MLKYCNDEVQQVNFSAAILRFYCLEVDSDVDMQDAMLLKES